VRICARPRPSRTDANIAAILDMLPWGTYFAERGEPKVGKERIAALVGYIKSLQQK
jgi:hypothetical protein